MNKANRHRRFALAALLATAAIGSAAPAQANTDCDARLDQLEAQFRQIEERRGWEAATEWWEKRWQAYYQHCGGS
jgi:hypothetical protein